MKLTRMLLLLVLFLLPACQPAQIEPSLELERLELKIFQQTNLLRAERGLVPLAPLSELDTLSRRHSLNMAQKDFFDHLDPDGNDPPARMSKFLPQLLSASSGENIALRSIDGDADMMARELMKLWRESKEHYTNIIKPEFRHLGVGVAQQQDRIYATQTFATGLALLENPPTKVAIGSSVNLSFRFLAEFPSNELTAFLHAPDPNARIPIGNGTSYVGRGPLKPVWTAPDHFELTFPANYGSGTYQIRLGHLGTFYDKFFSFVAGS